MPVLFDLLLARFFGSLHGHVQNSVLAPVSRFARQVSIGLSFLAASMVAWMLSLIFLFLSLFFYMAQINTYSVPALWTGLISLGIGLILAVLGINTMRHRP
jgi:hypothetical protein